uniref:Uncharacterized protein n=1 Tax=Craspedostauros australis TaxID=1486917 RepID=A0A7R9ZKJ3_9STRA
MKWKHPHAQNSNAHGHLRRCSDSVATRGRAQGQAVIEYLGKRPAMQNQSLIGSVTSASRFEDTRKSLEERLSNAVVETMDFDETEEVGRVFESLRSAAMVSAGLQIGALGSVGLAAMQSLDVIAASSSALAFVVTGGAWLYSGTTRIRGSYQQTWKLRASRLDAALEEICSKELERVNRRILDGVAPYTRFVETEQERTSDLVDRCEGVLSSSKNLRRRIGKL